MWGGELCLEGVSFSGIRCIRDSQGEVYETLEICHFAIFKALLLNYLEQMHLVCQNGIKTVRAWTLEQSFLV